MKKIEEDKSEPLFYRHKTNESNPTYWVEEMKKCSDSPYYFATKYMNVGGEKFTTKYSEKEFNELFLKTLR